MSIRVNSVVTEADILGWDWDESIAKVQGFYIGSWKQLSQELLETLYEAKLQINNGPGNPGNKYTWEKFCQHAFMDKNGKMMVTKRTVDTWIRRYEIGEAAWNAEQEAKRLAKLKAKGTSAPDPYDNEMMFIEKRIKNKDGSYTLRFRFSEYEDILFEETINV